MYLVVLLVILVSCFRSNASEYVSSASMPEQLRHSMTYQGRRVDLRLTKCSDTNSDVPTVFVGDKKSLRQFNHNQTYAAYNDATKRVSLIAKLDKEKNTLEFVQGLLTVGDKRYTLASMSPEERVGAGAAKRGVDMGGQMMVAEEEDMKTDRYFRDVVLKSNYSRSAYDKADNVWRSKRQSFLGSFTVETLIVTDYSVYSRFYSLSRKATTAERNLEAQSNLIYYYTNIANGVNQRYGTISGRDFAMNVRLVGIYISTDPSSSPFTENNFFKYVSGGETFVDSQMTYEAFKRWVTQFAVTNGRFFDQATMFTNYRMHYGFSQGKPIVITGIAHIGSMCHIANVTGIESTSTSLNVDRGVFASIGTMAHEIGHNLNSQHDGDGNACNFKDQFVMAAGPGELDNSNFNNIFTFSSCSANYISSLIRHLNGKPNANCLNTLSGPNYSPPVDQRLPGVKYNLSEQCQIINGPSSYYCGGDQQDPCALMQCYNQASQSCLTLNDVRAFDGSLCGNKKWCVRGRCVFDSQAPASPMGVEKCIYGDYRNPFGVASNANFMCSQIVPGSSHVAQCYDTNYTYARCCASCERVRTVNPPNCPFGDRDPAYCQTGTRERCYELHFNTTCCRTCALFRQNKTGCEYGDRYPSTCNVVASSCYQLESACCETCQKFLEPASHECRYGDHVTWCLSSNPLEILCPTNALNCCKSCRNVPGATTTVQSGCSDVSFQYCSNIQKTQCYDPSVQPHCCSTCARLNSGVPGCAFGNMAPWCGNVVTSAASCAVANTLANCCQSCGQFTGVTFPTTTRSPDVCRDTDFNYCNSRRPMECYFTSTRNYCCATCNRLKNGPAGCEYGNTADWCTSYVTSASSCVDGNVVQSCCQSCGRFAGSIPTTTPPPACRDQAFWCASVFSGQCYDPATERTCCLTCGRLRRLNEPSCRYGDRYSWCAPQYCNTDRSSCCAICTGPLSRYTQDSKGNIMDDSFIAIMILLFISMLNLTHI